MSVAALGVFSLPIRAEQTSTQGSNQTATITGDNNQINQYIIQLNVQKNQRNSKGKHQPQQGSSQGATQSADAVGSGNQINQDVQQVNVQQQNVHPRFHGRGHKKSLEKS
ncbi:hypothetical protein [Mastigocladopsis repens]|uniref:hypothetical protein n=1 Tax=Mastigocladopsis repens TaxID=221287 RepID=UPI0002E6A491|nr:hypothetical protein [Mastigocladopsis repens]